MYFYWQKNKLRYLLDKLDKMLGIRGGQRKWDVQCKEGVNVKISGCCVMSFPCLHTAIHSKDVVAILHMLVAMARYFHCRYPLPRNVRVKRIHLKVYMYLYSGTSDKGPSEIGTTSLQRTLVVCII